MNLIRYVLIRILALIMQIIGAIALIISITTVINLDPTILQQVGVDPTNPNSDTLGAGNTPSDEEISQFRQELGVDKSLFERFFDYIEALFTRGDLGSSWVIDDGPVVDLYLDRFIQTMLIFGLGILLFTIIAIVLGIMAAKGLDGSLDKNVRLTTSFFYAFPPFVLGILLIFLVEGFVVVGLREKLTFFLGERYNLNVFNDPFKSIFDSSIGDFSFDTTFHYLPILTVVLIYTGFQFRLVRIYMSEVLNQNYIRTAFAKGLGERTIVLKHGLRNALPEVITTIATTFPVAFSGVAVLEKVFNIDGAGVLLIDSGLFFDWPVLIGGAVIFTTLNALILMITDLIVHYVDPQLRLR